jgi:hypothetical protein
MDADAARVLLLKRRPGQDEGSSLVKTVSQQYPQLYRWMADDRTPEEVEDQVRERMFAVHAVDPLTLRVCHASQSLLTMHSQQCPVTGHEFGNLATVPLTGQRQHQAMQQLIH